LPGSWWIAKDIDHIFRKALAEIAPQKAGLPQYANHQGKVSLKTTFHQK
jgi:hypothetical protein